MRFANDGVVSSDPSVIVASCRSSSATPARLASNSTSAGIFQKVLRDNAGDAVSNVGADGRLDGDPWVAGGFGTAAAERFHRDWNWRFGDQIDAESAVTCLVESCLILPVDRWTFVTVG